VLVPAPSKFVGYFATHHNEPPTGLGSGHSQSERPFPTETTHGADTVASGALAVTFL